ncbi:MAG: hypothetical protein PGN13_04100 [Patulibacter minatonensis]
MLLRTALTGAAALLVAVPCAQSAQTLKLDLASPANAVTGGVAVQSAKLQRRAYVVTVSGTGSLWHPDDAAPVNCGAPEPGKVITDPTPGQPVAVPTVDAAVVYAAPRGVPFLGGYACVEPTPKAPPAQAALRMGVGGVLSARAPIGGQPKVPSASHSYAYVVVGAGRPLQFQYADPVVWDNSGRLAITIRTLPECAAAVGACLPTAAPTLQMLASLKPPKGPLPCVFPALAAITKAGDRGQCA